MRYWYLLILSFFFIAAAYDIKEMTPAIEQALQNRQARYNQIQQMKEGGVLGEDNKGYVKVIRPLPEADAIVDAETPTAGRFMKRSSSKTN